MPLSHRAIGQLCDHFLTTELGAAGLRRPGRNYDHEVTRSDERDAYVIQIWAMWGRDADVRTRRLRFEVELRQLGTETETARAIIHYIESQVRELEAGCDDVERGGALRARPFTATMVATTTATPWYGPVTVTAQQLSEETSRALEQRQQHALALAAQMDQSLSEFGQAANQQIFASPKPLPSPEKAFVRKSRWQHLCDD